MTDIIFSSLHLQPGNNCFFFSAPKKRNKGALGLLLELPDLNSQQRSLSQEIWRQIHDSFYNNQSDDPYFCFEEALRTTSGFIDEKQKKLESGSLGRINAVVIMIAENQLHFSNAGNGTLYLRRGQYFSAVSEKPDPNQKVFLSVSSGETMEGDGLLCSTNKLPFDTDDLYQAVILPTEQEVLSAIKMLAKKTESSATVAYTSLPYANSADEISKEIDETADEIKSLENNLEDITKELEKAQKDVVDSNAWQKALDKLKGIDFKRFSQIPNTLHRLGKNVSDLINKGRNGNEEAGTVLDKNLSLEKNIDSEETEENVYPDTNNLPLLESFHYTLKKLRRNPAIVLVGLGAIVILLATGLYFQGQYKENQEQLQRYERIFQNAVSNITSAENTYLLGDKEEAYNILKTAEKSLIEVEEAGFFLSDIGDIREEINKKRDYFDNIKRVKSENLNLVADFSEKGLSEIIGVVNTKEQKDFAFEKRKLAESILGTVQEPLIIDPEEVVVSGTELESFNVIAFITANGQLIEYQLRNGRFDSISTQDESWKKGVDVSTFGGRLFYILSPEDNTIWKYQRLRNTYGQAAAYSSEGELQNAVSMAIDGEVYVLKQDGSILRYLRGALQDFQMRDLPSIPMKNPSKIVTFPEAQSIYILDSQNQRIIVFDKPEGGISYFKQQYVFESLSAGEIVDFYVDIDEQNLSVITNSQLYQVSLIN